MLKVCIRSLVDRATARFTRVDVAAVSAIPGVSEIREGFQVRFIVDIDAIADAVVRKTGKRSAGQNSCDGPRRDVRDVIGNATAIRETGSIASQQAPCASLLKLRSVELPYSGEANQPPDRPWFRERRWEEHTGQAEANRCAEHPEQECRRSQFRTLASSGSSAKLANWASSLGSLMLNLSFEPVPMMSSLNSGLPMR